MSEEVTIIRSVRGHAWAIEGRHVPDELGAQIKQLDFAPGELWCGCCANSRAPVSFVAGEIRRPHFRWLSGEHAPSCIGSAEVSRHIAGTRDGGDVFRVQILAAQSASPSERAGKIVAFNLLMRQVFDAAYTGGYIHAVRTGSLGCTYRKLVSEVYRVIGAERFAEGMTIADGLRQQGLDLRVGVVRDLWFLSPGDVAVPQARYPILLAGLGANFREGAVVEVLEDVLRAAMRRFQIFTEYVQGPYLAIAAVDVCTGQARHLRLFPVAFLNGLIGPVESEAERIEMVTSWGNHIATYKPLSLRLLNRLPNELRHTDGKEAVMFEYRPDEIYRIAGRLHVKEVIGRPDDPIYMALIERKDTYYRRMQAAGLIVYVRVEAPDREEPRMSARPTLRTDRVVDLRTRKLSA